MWSSTDCTNSAQARSAQFEPVGHHPLHHAKCPLDALCPESDSDFAITNHHLISNNVIASHGVAYKECTIGNGTCRNNRIIQCLHRQVWYTNVLQLCHTTCCRVIVLYVFKALHQYIAIQIKKSKLSYSAYKQLASNTLIIFPYSLWW